MALEDEALLGDAQEAFRQVLSADPDKDQEWDNESKREALPIRPRAFERSQSAEESKAKAPAPKPTKAAGKRGGTTWFNRPVYPWVTNGNNTPKPAVDPPKPVPSA